jgi:hypothetical protein
VSSGQAQHARTSAAFVDESQSNSARDPDTYILAAAVCDGAVLAATRQSFAGLRLKGQHKLHWRDEGEKRRQEIAATIAAAPLRHLIVVRDGQPGEKPERRRRHCLERLLYELDQLGVGTVTFESRGRKDDKRDRDMLDALRTKRVVATDLRMEHVAGPREALLWVADAVCGAVVQSRTGESIYLEMIQASVEIQVIVIGPPGK